MADGEPRTGIVHIIYSCSMVYLLVYSFVYALVGHLNTLATHDTNASVVDTILNDAMERRLNPPGPGQEFENRFQ